MGLVFSLDSLGLFSECLFACILLELALSYFRVEGYGFPSGNNLSLGDLLSRVAATPGAV